MSLAPVVLFVYKRPAHTLKTLKSLKVNELADGSELIIYCDGPKENASLEDLKLVDEVRKVIRSDQWCNSMKIVESPKNNGLAKSIIDGVTETINSYGKVIVLEDDIVTSKYFLRFMNASLDKYANEDKVAAVSGYVYPMKTKLPESFFLRYAECWGWGTWKRGWEIFNPNGEELLNQMIKNKLLHEFDFYNTYHYSRMLKEQVEGKIDSWALLWYASVFLKNKLTLLPGTSLVQNIGFDSSGTHGDNTTDLNVTLSNAPILVSDISIEERVENRKAMALFFKSLKPKVSLGRRVINILRNKQNSFLN